MTGKLVQGQSQSLRVQWRSTPKFGRLFTKKRGWRWVFLGWMVGGGCLSCRKRADFNIDFFFQEKKKKKGEEENWLRFRRFIDGYKSPARRPVRHQSEIWSRRNRDASIDDDDEACRRFRPVDVAGAVRPVRPAAPPASAATVRLASGGGAALRGGPAALRLGIAGRRFRFRRSAEPPSAAAARKSSAKTRRRSDCRGCVETRTGTLTLLFVPSRPKLDSGPRIIRSSMMESKCRFCR